MMLAQCQELFSRCCSLLPGIIPCLLSIEQSKQPLSPEIGAQLPLQVLGGCVCVATCTDLWYNLNRGINLQSATARGPQAFSRVRTKLSIAENTQTQNGVDCR